MMECLECLFWLILLNCFCVCVIVQRSGAAFEQEVRERATVLQTDFENYVHANNESLQRAKSGGFIANRAQSCSLFYSV